MIDWSKYPNFSKHEFDCKETGENEMKPEFLARLQGMRTEHGKIIQIRSGYRSPRHSIEARKDAPGTHAKGIACDIPVGPGENVHRIVELAIKHGFTGIGISQRAGRPRFVHIDTDSRKAIWSY